MTGIRDEAAVMRVINVIAETDLHTHIDMTPLAAATVMLRWSNAQMQWIKKKKQGNKNSCTLISHKSPKLWQQQTRLILNNFTEVITQT